MCDWIVFTSAYVVVPFLSSTTPSTHTIGTTSKEAVLLACVELM